MINYEPKEHANGKFRLLEEREGSKRFVTKGKQRYFSFDEMQALIAQCHADNECRAKMRLNNPKI